MKLLSSKFSSFNNPIFQSASRILLRNLPSSFSSTNLDYFNWILGQSVEQLTPIDPSLSDHCMAINEDILFFNTMMHAKKKEDGNYNNAFCSEEQISAYHKRIENFITVLSLQLKMHPEVDIICLSEACIKPADQACMANLIGRCLPDWHRVVVYDNTDFGVMTIIRDCSKNKFFYQDGVLIERYGCYLANRCRTFSNNTVKLSNIHVPYADPKSSFEKLLRVIIDDLMSGNIKNHKIVGDFNLSPSDIEDCLKTVWQEKVKTSAANNQPPHALYASFFPSENGHLKADGQRYTVDGVLSLKIEPAKTNRFYFTYAASMAAVMTTALYTLTDTLPIEDMMAAKVAARCFL